jgi:BirA family biotin operon repressor/biotin-[acetyl-CoA-carboxylase] ligase
MYNKTMDIKSWSHRLDVLSLGEIYLYKELGSTNQVAEDLIEQGAPHLSLILADSQTEGRGRSGRSWVTKSGKALAFSLILYPDPALVRDNQLERISGLGSLAVAEVLKEKLGLNAEIKWPNDVLIDGKKVSGVLVELHWDGTKLKSVVIGIGINVYKESVPDIELNFPAASLEDFWNEPISRLDLLVELLQAILKWYPRIDSPSFIKKWDDYLAFKGEQVTLLSGDTVIEKGCLEGLSPDGYLLINSETGDQRSFRTGEIQLRLVDRF